MRGDTPVSMMKFGVWGVNWHNPDEDASCDIHTHAHAP